MAHTQRTPSTMSSGFHSFPLPWPQWVEIAVPSGGALFAAMEGARSPLNTACSVVLTFIAVVRFVFFVIDRYKQNPPEPPES